jgi:hypothetical protein
LTTTQVASIFAVEQPIERKEVGQVEVPKDFRLSFTIKPLEMFDEWTNILLLSESQNNKLVAGIWVPPSSTSIYFIFANGQDADGEDIFGGYQTEDLPTNTYMYSTIVINAVARR